MRPQRNRLLSIHSRSSAAPNHAIRPSCPSRLAASHGRCPSEISRQSHLHDATKSGHGPHQLLQVRGEPAAGAAGGRGAVPVWAVGRSSAGQRPVAGGVAGGGGTTGSRGDSQRGVSGREGAALAGARTEMHPRVAEQRCSRLEPGGRAGELAGRRPAFRFTAASAAPAVRFGSSKHRESALEDH